MIDVREDLVSAFRHPRLVEFYRISEKTWGNTMQNLGLGYSGIICCPWSAAGIGTATIPLISENIQAHSPWMSIDLSLLMR